MKEVWVRAEHKYKPVVIALVFDDGRLKTAANYYFGIYKRPKTTNGPDIVSFLRSKSFEVKHLP